jgi:glycerophosphoryl diester phosphodiesterase
VTGPIAAFAARFGWPAGATYPLAIGHHGASGHQVENTLAAFARGAGLCVEIKAPAAAPPVWRHLEAEGQRFAAFGSFDIATVRALRDAHCPYPLAVLVPLGADPLATAEAAGADIAHLCRERGGPR